MAAVMDWEDGVRFVYLERGSGAYHSECANQLRGGTAFDGSDLADEIGDHADDGDEGDKLARPHDSKCHAQGTELWSLKPHVGRRRGDDLERRASLGSGLKGESWFRKRSCWRWWKGGLRSYDGQPGHTLGVKTRDRSTGDEAELDGGCCCRYPKRQGKQVLVWAL